LVLEPNLSDLERQEWQNAKIAGGDSPTSVTRDDRRKRVIAALAASQNPAVKQYVLISTGHTGKREIQHTNEDQDNADESDHVFDEVFHG
jgi:hypothetical protein